MVRKTAADRIVQMNEYMVSSGKPQDEQRFWGFDPRESLRSSRGLGG